MKNRLRTNAISIVMLSIFTLGPQVLAQTSDTPSSDTQTEKAEHAQDSPVEKADESESSEPTRKTESSDKSESEQPPVNETTDTQASTDAPSNDTAPAATSTGTIPLKSGVNASTLANSSALKEELAGPSKECCCCKDKDKKVDEEEVIVPKTNNPVIALQDDLFLGTLLITAWGIHFWDWFEEAPHFKKEHGFTQESSTGGADKVGHAYTSFLMADYLNWRLRKQGFSRNRASIYGSLLAMGLMTWIEIGDSTSAYGFSMEDLLADFIGVSLSATLGMVPIMDDLLDFRLWYWPTDDYAESGEVVADYSGMKFILALRMSGIPVIKKTPLRFVEWHLGYYSRGFRTFDDETSTSRVLYWGMGIDLIELLDPILPKVLQKPVDTILTYYQIPYTSWELYGWEHEWSESTEPAQ